MARSSLTGPLTQVSVRIAPQAEEAVAALFETVVGQPASVYTDEDSRITTATVYLPRKDWTAARKLKLEEGLHQLRAFGLETDGKLKAKTIRRENWAESWKKHFKPLEIGRSLLIKPSWSRRRPRKGQQVVVLDPGLSFGTGQHATTSFCLQQLVRIREKDRPQAFLDIGTGSGILAIAAARLGYEPIQAFDFDPESVRVSRDNARINDVAGLVRPTRRDLTRMPPAKRGRFDLVCANLTADLLTSQAAKIVTFLKADGALVLAGILATQFEAVVRCYARLGWRLQAEQTEREWRSGWFRGSHTSA